jgi:hypothetical protein
MAYIGLPALSKKVGIVSLENIPFALSPLSLAFFGT